MSFDGILFLKGICLAKNDKKFLSILAIPKILLKHEFSFILFILFIIFIPLVPISHRLPHREPWLTFLREFLINHSQVLTNI